MELYTETVHKLFTCLYFFVVEFFTLFCFNMSLERKIIGRRNADRNNIKSRPVGFDGGSI